MRHDSFICEPCLIHTWHDSFIHSMTNMTDLYVTWLWVGFRSRSFASLRSVSMYCREGGNACGPWWYFNYHVMYFFCDLLHIRTYSQVTSFVHIWWWASFICDMTVQLCRRCTYTHTGLRSNSGLQRRAPLSAFFPSHLPGLRCL